jgi:RHS repeat-associated protein
MRDDPAHNLNQYTSAGSTAVTSDANGNIQSRDGWTYSYDAQSRLRRAAKGTVFLDFYYDGLNRQITRSVQTGSGSRVTFSVWDGWNLLEEHGLGDVLQRMYFYGGKTDELACAFGGVQPNSWVVQDGRGNVSHIFNDSNNLVERYTYGLAGEPQIRDGSGNLRSESAVENRFLFQGRDYLKEGAIYDYRNRFYLPALGRFIQPDPIGFKGDPGNLYRYCGNDPVNRSDPMGLDSDIFLFREYADRNAPARYVIFNDRNKQVYLRRNTWRSSWRLHPTAEGNPVESRKISVRSTRDYGERVSFEARTTKQLLSRACAGSSRVALWRGS